jgi:hypothetical protein
MAKRVRKIVKPKFDWDGFKLLGGIGLFFSAFGPFLFWVVYTAPSESSESYALSTTQRLARMIPNEISAKVVSVFAILSFLFGAFMVFTALYRAIRFLIYKK